MRFQYVAPIVGFASLVLGFSVSNIPDGVWLSEQYENGTIFTTSLDDPTLPPIITQGVFIPRRKEKRNTIGGGGQCWGYELDHVEVDICNKALQNAAASANPLTICTGASNAYIHSLLGNVMVYFCIDTSNACGSVYPAGIQDGMGRMDALCQPYEGSWIEWPGTYEILGKCYAASLVCV